MTPSALDPRGRGAEVIEQLWWVLLLVCALVALLTLAALVYAALRPRHEWQRPAPEQDRGATRAIVYAGIVGPVIILAGLFIYVMAALGALSVPGDSPYTIVVTSYQWWWDVRYRFPEQAAGFRTANELRIPVGQRVRIDLESFDVIHSFWVPQLHGKIDLIPGRRNEIWLHANEPGVYRGQCAEFCGLQHTRMAFHVIAMEPSDFDAWLVQQRRPAPEPGTEVERLGREVYESRGCTICHAVRGTSSRGNVAPDLTHVASRLYLAAGTIPTTRGHLSGWISDPQHVKPGVNMPRVPLEPLELHNLVTWLLTLK